MLDDRSAGRESLDASMPLQITPAIQVDPCGAQRGAKSTAKRGSPTNQGLGPNGSELEGRRSLRSLTPQAHVESIRQLIPLLVLCVLHRPQAQVRKELFGHTSKLPKSPSSITITASLLTPISSPLPLKPQRQPARILVCPTRLKTSTLTSSTHCHLLKNIPAQRSADRRGGPT